MKRIVLTGHLKSTFLKCISIALITFLSLGMAVTIMRYATFESNTGFLTQKQEYISNSFWLTAFYIHVFSCFFCLFAGITQFSNYLLSQQKNLHRLLGKIYIGNIFFINAPVGLVLALYANGGLVAKSAFVVLDLLWFAFTLIAFVEIRRKNISRHREFMIRSYALTLSAITFRLLKPFLLAVTSLSVSNIYIIDSWLAFSINLLVAEMLIYFARKKIISKSQIRQRIKLKPQNQ